jgi:hypothetical protein
MVLDRFDQKLREDFSTHINLSCLFSKPQSAILPPLQMHFDLQIRHYLFLIRIRWIFRRTTKLLIILNSTYVS